MIDWRIRLVPMRGATRRYVDVLCALVILATLLDHYWPIAAPPADLAFWQIIAIIAGAIGHFIHTAADAVVAALVTAVHFIRAGIVLLGKGLKTGIFELGRTSARVLRALKTFAVETVPRFIKWSYAKLVKLSGWLKLKLGPVLRWLKLVKCHIDDIYKKYVRPVIDTIEFIRAVNRTLLIFHVDLLRKLDSVLAQIEQRIEEPFAWVRGKITWLENTIDRIITFDGLIQRFALIASMSKHAPAWINGFWHRQVGDDFGPSDGVDPTQKYPRRAVQSYGIELGDAYRGQPADFLADLSHFTSIWGDAATGAIEVSE